MKASLYFDGACHGNPGPSAGGAVLRIETRMEPKLVQGGVFHGTNNQAEYSGLISGLHEALKAGVRHIEIRGDSKLVVEQVNGRWRAKQAHLRSLQGEAQMLLAQFDSWSLEWIPRESNKIADRTANQALRNGIYPRR